MRLERKLVWIFFILLLIDGVLRKWLLPSLASIIMLLKQLVGIYLVFNGYSKGRITNKWSQFSVLIGFVGFFLTLFFGHQNMLVAFWGGLDWWFGIPLVVIIEQTLIKNDVFKMLKVVLYFSIFNSIVTTIQFFSPITSLINRQIGDEIVDVSIDKVSDLAGMFRCSGLFGYISQSSNFAPFSLGIILFYIISMNLVPKRLKIYNWVIITALISHIFLCIFSVSRSTIFYSLFTASFFIYALLSVNENRKYLFLYVVFLFVSILILVSIPIFNDSIQTISNRFDNAASTTDKNGTIIETINDIINRGIIYTIDGIINPRTIDGREIPFWGYGQGMSTQVGGRMLGLHNNSGFSLAEWDSKRYINESGVFLGLLMIFCRLGFVVSKFKLVLKHLKIGNSLPFLIYPSFFLSFYILNQWGNTFHFNLSLFIGGLCLASIRLNFNGRRNI